MTKKEQSEDTSEDIRKTECKWQFMKMEAKGKHAVTHYKVLERFKYMTWVECKLETGRTHQIRAHFKHIGHTLLTTKDMKVIKFCVGKLTKIQAICKNVFEVLPRHALHAHTLGFIHPTTKKKCILSHRCQKICKMR